MSKANSKKALVALCLVAVSVIGAADSASARPCGTPKSTHGAHSSGGGLDCAN